MTSSLDYTVVNHAPNSDAVTISVFDIQPPTADDSIEIRIWRNEDQSVQLEVTDCDGTETRIILGGESVTTKC